MALVLSALIPAHALAATARELMATGMPAAQAVLLAQDSIGADLIPSTDDTYDLGSSTKEWADLYVDGVAYVDALGQDALPSADGTYDLGSSTAEWEDLYVDGVAYIDNANIGAVSATLNPTANNTYDLGQGGIAWKDATFAGIVTSSNRIVTPFFRQQDTDGGYLDTQSTCVTNTTDEGAGTSTISSVIPAGAVVLGVTCRVDSTISGAGASTFSLGDGTDADLYGTGIAFAAGTTIDETDYTASPLTQAWSASSGDLIMTANAGQFDAGSITCCSHYFVTSAPAS